MCSPKPLLIESLGVGGLCRPHADYGCEPIRGHSENWKSKRWQMSYRVLEGIEKLAWKRTMLRPFFSVLQNTEGQNWGDRFSGGANVNS